MKRPGAIATRRRALAAWLALLRAAPSRASRPVDGDGCLAVGPDVGASVPEELTSPLADARALRAPPAIDAEGAEFEHAEFWEGRGPLLRAAWEEWEGGEFANGVGSSNSGVEEFVEPALSLALDGAFANPTEDTEALVKSLWTADSDDDEHLLSLPKGVYSARLLTEAGIRRIRGLLDAASSSGIPTRRPNGMNRRGVIVDPDVPGAVPVTPLVRLLEEELIERVVRPVGRALFLDRVGCDDDAEYFAFTIRYDGRDGDDGVGEASGEYDDGMAGDAPKRDFELREHRDASLITLNVNLNLPEEGYSGSEVFFREFPSDDPLAEDCYRKDGLCGEDEGGVVRFSPGMAIIHLGAHRHGALPISDSAGGGGAGKRYNLVIWLFGKHGDVRISPYEEEERMRIVERWRGCNHTEAIMFRA